MIWLMKGSPLSVSAQQGHIEGPFLKEKQGQS